LATIHHGSQNTEWTAGRTASLGGEGERLLRAGGVPSAAEARAPGGLAVASSFSSPLSSRFGYERSSRAESRASQRSENETSSPTSYADGSVSRRA